MGNPLLTSITLFMFCKTPHGVIQRLPAIFKASEDSSQAGWVAQSQLGAAQVTGQWLGAVLSPTGLSQAEERGSCTSATWRDASSLLDRKSVV